MRGNTALLVSLLLVAAAALAPIGAAAGSTTTGEVPDRVVATNGTANYLTVPEEDVQRSGYSDTGLDMSTAFASDTQELQADHETVAFEQSFRQAESDEERNEVVRSTVERLERETTSLQARDRDVVRGYANGSLTLQQFVRERALIQAEAEKISTSKERVRTIVAGTNGYSAPNALVSRLTTLDGELNTLKGPVSDRVLRASEDDRQQMRLYAEASQTGYTVSYVRDGEFVRETYLSDERNRSAPDRFDSGSDDVTDTVESRGEELYPWVTDQPFSPATQGWGTSGVYRYSLDYNTGSLSAYIDGGTTNVFREAQHRQLSTVSPSETYTDANGTLQITMNRTYDSGPMHLTVSRTGTGVPANSSIVINGESFGYTGEDGQMWVVEPRGPVRINVTTTSGDSVIGRVPG